ncbi:unnamed protein product [Camellia sinensis]
MAKTMRKPELLMVSRFLRSPSQGLHRITYTRSLETLAFEEVRASPERPDNNFTAFVLHGLFGSVRTWRSFSRTLASYLSNSSPYSNWRMVLVDLRNHGRSAEIEGLNPPHDMANAAKDLADLIKSQGLAWPDVVLGHSMGGKVALQFAESCALGYYGESAQLPKQKWLMDQMSRLGFSKSLSHWIGSNLKNSGEHETWAFNLEVETDYWPLLEHPPKEMEVAIVRAEKSDRWDVDVIQRLEHLASWRSGASEGKVSVHVLPNSGHWVHVDNPKGLLEIVAPRIASIA